MGRIFPFYCEGNSVGREGNCKFPFLLNKTTRERILFFNFDKLLVLIKTLVFVIPPFGIINCINAKCIVMRLISLFISLPHSINAVMIAWRSLFAYVIMSLISHEQPIRIDCIQLNSEIQSLNRKTKLTRRVNLLNWRFKEFLFINESIDFHESFWLYFFLVLFDGKQYR